jgi:hypothetical protein
LSHPMSSGGRWPSFVPIEMGEEVEVYSANTVNFHPCRNWNKRVAGTGLGLARVEICLLARARCVHRRRRDAHLNASQYA